MLRHRAICCILLFFAGGSSALAELSAISKRLAYCNGVYVFAMAWRQSEDDSKGLEDAISLYARVVTANFWLNEAGGAITESVVGEWNSERIGLPEKLFNDRDFARREIVACQKITDEGWFAARSLDKKVQGISLEQFRDDNIVATRNALGLK